MIYEKIKMIEIAFYMLLYTLHSFLQKERRQVIWKYYKVMKR